ncbi:response regulator transcription factor [Spirosoma sp.]|uniref:response regulator transcription factor n=1 Tax=Spirosoma sp. TaxID=1899569 RepID=UPI002610008A|nr:response regulator transcription factor [Spirosoma sp.]MCX6213680.1 response regulator transcription factor [Spirosoma sp.]
METAHILLVEDEPFLAQVIKESLEQRNYQVTHSGDGRRAHQLFSQYPFSLCIVDVMLPYVDGFSLVRQIRTINERVPVLFLTARTATPDVIEGYASGGNDYLKKPFSLEELFLRVHELLKRTSVPAPEPSGSWLIGQYEFVPHKQTLQFPDQPSVRLSYRETQLLQLLYDHRNTSLDRRQVLLGLWGDDSYFHGRSLDVFITKLRKHLKQDESVEILNLRGIGYKLIC